MYKEHFYLELLYVIAFSSPVKISKSFSWCGISCKIRVFYRKLSSRLVTYTLQQFSQIQQRLERETTEIDSVCFSLFGQSILRGCKVKGGI